MSGKGGFTGGKSRLKLLISSGETPGSKLNALTVSRTLAQRRNEPGN